MPEFDSTVVYREAPEFPGHSVGSNGSVWKCQNRKRAADPVGRDWVICTIRIAKRKRDTRRIVSINRKMYLVSRVVLTAFSGPCPEGMEACHNNGLSYDDRISNLRWDTRKSNQRDRVIHGTNLCGQRHPMSKLTEEDVLKIRSSFIRGTDSARRLAEQYGVQRNAIHSIIRKSTWSHI